MLANHHQKPIKIDAPLDMPITPTLFGVVEWKRLRDAASPDIGVCVGFELGVYGQRIMPHAEGPPCSSEEQAVADANLLAESRSSPLPEMVEWLVARLAAAEEACRELYPFVDSEDDDDYASTARRVAAKGKARAVLETAKETTTDAK